MCANHSNSFHSYENEFESLTSQVQRDLGAFTAAIENKKPTTEQQECASQLRVGFEKCHVILQKLRLEARNCDKDEKEELLSRIKLYKIQVKALQEHFNTCRINSDRNTILALKNERCSNDGESRKERSQTSSNTTPAPYGRSHTAKSSELDSRLKLNKQNNMLERARQSLAEVENLAGDISENLAANREIIESSQEKTKDLHRMSDDADNILTRMKKRWI